MPVCKNDPKAHYQGTEPSPKGLGYCAHAEDIGTIRKGLDGNKWITQLSGKSIRWIKYDPTSDLLYKKIYKEWWSKLSSGGIIVIYDDSTYKLYVSNKKNIRAQSKEIITLWREMADDPTVKMIVWSPISSDALTLFVEKLVRMAKRNKNLSKSLLKTKTLNILLKNPKKYFTKYEFISDKDYVV